MDRDLNPCFPEYETTVLVTRRKAQFREHGRFQNKEVNIIPEYFSALLASRSFVLNLHVRNVA